MVEILQVKIENLQYGCFCYLCYEFRNILWNTHTNRMLSFTAMISLDTLQRNIGLPHWEDVVAHRVRQRGTTLREWVGQRATTLRGWVRQEVTALAKLAAPVVSCLAMFPASSPPFHPIMYFPFTHCTTKKLGRRK